MGKPLNRCVIVGAAPYTDAALLSRYIRENDFIIAADGGCRLVDAMEKKPDLIVADFDSSDRSGDVIDCLMLPTHKDDTDVLAALREAIERGYRDFLLLGCIGGRLDHTLANIFLLQFMENHGAVGQLVDEKQEVRLLCPGEYHVPPQKGRSLSLLPYGGDVRGVTLQHVVYPLENATLTTDFPLGVSNEFSDKPAAISFTEGHLLMIIASDF